MKSLTGLILKCCEVFFRWEPFTKAINRDFTTDSTSTIKLTNYKANNLKNMFQIK
jgi:hypothetical protein